MHHVISPYRHVLLWSVQSACLHWQYRLSQSPIPWQTTLLRDFGQFIIDWQALNKCSFVCLLCSPMSHQVERVMCCRKTQN